MKKSVILSEFSKLSLSRHASLIKSAVTDYPPYSEFNLTNLFAWDIDSTTEISRLDRGLALLLKDYKTGKQFYTVIGSQNMDSVMKRLIGLSIQKDLGDLRRVPQTVVDCLRKPSDFIIQEDRDNFDYMLSAKYHAELAGSKNEDRRYLARSFLKKNGDKLELKNINLKDRQDKADIRGCLSNWLQDRSKTVIGEIERTAISRVMDAADRLPVKTLGFYIDGKMRAFSIFEYIDESVAIVHFEKCDLSYKGIAQFVHNIVAKECLAEGRQYINYEQDLGIEGLRKAKSMLHPDSFLKKYTVTLKT